MKEEKKIELIRKFANKALKQGFRVFLSDKETYGFFTNKEGEKIIYFETQYSGLVFFGQYEAKEPSRIGAGWRIETDSTDCHELFKETPPRWVMGGAKYKYIKLKDFLEKRNHSKYTEIKK